MCLCCSIVVKEILKQLLCLKGGRPFAVQPFCSGHLFFCFFFFLLEWIAFKYCSPIQAVKSKVFWTKRSVCLPKIISFEKSCGFYFCLKVKTRQAVCKEPGSVAIPENREFKKWEFRFFFLERQVLSKS